VLYDYEAGRVVACGEVGGSATFVARLDLHDWYLVIDDMLDHVRTPF